MLMENMASYMRQRYAKNKAWAMKELGNKCSFCGGTSRLEFDHILKETKEATFTTLLRGRGRSRLTNELVKCRLLCSECYKERHSPLHGTRSRYVNRKCRCPSCRDANRLYYNERRLCSLTGKATTS